MNSRSIGSSIDFGAAPPVLAEHSFGSDSKLQVLSTAELPKSFSMNLSRAIEAYPANLLSKLVEAEWKLVTGRRSVEIVPELNSFDTLEMSADDRTFESISALVLPERKWIVMASDFRDQESNRYVRENEVEAVFRHEAGHALDYALGNKSQRSQFRAFYCSDREAIERSPTTSKKLAYFLERGWFGRSEVFAEVAAILTGGGLEKYVSDNYFLRCFQRSSGYVARAIGKLI